MSNYIVHYLKGRVNVAIDVMSVLCHQLALSGFSHHQDPVGRANFHQDCDSTLLIRVLNELLFHWNPQVDIGGVNFVGLAIVYDLQYSNEVISG